MTLSQEILVLDFGDDKQSDFLKSELSSAEFGKGTLLFLGDGHTLSRSFATPNKLYKVTV